MNRRGFLGALLSGLAGTAAAHTLDLDRLLWVPGQKTIFIPSPRYNTFLLTDELVDDAIRILKNQLMFTSLIHRTYDTQWHAYRLSR